MMDKAASLAFYIKLALQAGLTDKETHQLAQISSSHWYRIKDDPELLTDAKQDQLLELADAMDNAIDQGILPLNAGTKVDFIRTLLK